MIQRKDLSNMRVFLTVWFGQLVSLTGSGLSGFALGIWVYQRTGSATQFALITLFASLPGILLSPITGTLADRWNRRYVMLFSNLGAGLVILGIALLFWANLLQVWIIYVMTTAISICTAFQVPAYEASVSLLVPKRQYGRASGMVQTAEAVGQVGAPVLAGILILLVGLPTVLLIDFATYLFGIATLLIVRFPQLNQPSSSNTAKKSVLREAGDGWNYVKKQRGLLALLSFFAATNIFIGMTQVLITPLVLSFGSPAILGVIFSVAGGGLLTGSLVMSIWGGPKHRMYGIYSFAVLQALSLVLVGLRPNAILIGIAVFTLLFSGQILRGCSTTIIRGNIPQAIQGRVFGINRLIGWSTLPFAYLIAGPLADRVFGPLLISKGPLAGSVGQFIGVGAGRGIGFLLLTLGCIYVLITVIAYISPHLRRIEDELEVAIPQDAMKVV
jgi:MFS transporter, DHA3 family, macrolide efflux protein